MGGRRREGWEGEGERDGRERERGSLLHGRSIMPSSEREWGGGGGKGEREGESWRARCGEGEEGKGGRLWYAWAERQGQVNSETGRAKGRKTGTEPYLLASTVVAKDTTLIHSVQYC